VDNPSGPGVYSYVKSKALAERVAWDLIEKERGSLELSVVNPRGIYGPSARAGLCGFDPAGERLLNVAMPRCPSTGFWGGGRQRRGRLAPSCNDGP
jgi:nucleoside-diphosphate-sugar epimerase